MSSAQPITDAAPSTIRDWRELALREGDGLQISLWWSKSHDRVKVSVLDARLVESFNLDIAGADALSAFHHPFAHAAWRPLCLGGALCESLDNRRTERSI